MKKLLIILLIAAPLLSSGQYRKSTARLDRVRLVYVMSDTLDMENPQYWPVQFEQAKKRKHDQKRVWGVFLLIIIGVSLTS